MSIDRFAVIGDPIEHSLSPAMQRAALRAAGIPASYDAVRVPCEELSTWVEHAGSAGISGFNVTIPHKQAIVGLLDSLDGSARAVGAVNTVVLRNGRLEGHNTDVEGFKGALAQLGLGASITSALVFGAGGAARAAVHALAGFGTHILLVDRSRERAEALGVRYGKQVEVLATEDPEPIRHLAEIDLLVNATPLGMAGHEARSPLPDGWKLRHHTVVFDMVYGQPTPLARQAARYGCRYTDGAEMLVQQGAAAFRLWTGSEPDLEVMRRACRREESQEQPCFAS